MVFNTAWDLGEWDLVEEACRAMSRKGQREVIEDTLPPEEMEGEISNCRELAETLKKRRESSGEDALEVLIEVYSKYERELLKSRGLNPYLYKLKAVKTEEGVSFYAVRRPITLAILKYLRDRMGRWLRDSS